MFNRLHCLRFNPVVCCNGVGPIFVHGVSGGGLMALHLLADDPMRWAGLSLWVPLTDLARWHDEDKAADGRYYRDVEACCGGPPGPDTAAGTARSASPTSAHTSSPTKRRTFDRTSKTTSLPVLVDWVI